MSVTDIPGLSPVYEKEDTREEERREGEKSREETKRKEKRVSSLIISAIGARYGALSFFDPLSLSVTVYGGLTRTATVSGSLALSGNAFSANFHCDNITIRLPVLPTFPPLWPKTLPIPTSNKNKRWKYILYLFSLLSSLGEANESFSLYSCAVFSFPYTDLHCLCVSNTE